MQFLVELRLSLPFVTMMKRLSTEDDEYKEMYLLNTSGSEKVLESFLWIVSCWKEFIYQMDVFNLIIFIGPYRIIGSLLKSSTWVDNLLHELTYKISSKIK